MLREREREIERENERERVREKERERERKRSKEVHTTAELTASWKGFCAVGASVKVPVVKRFCWACTATVKGSEPVGFSPVGPTTIARSRGLKHSDRINKIVRENKG